MAKIYHIETKYIIRALKRNQKKFPPDFYFQLTEEEFSLAKAIPCYREKLKHLSKPPYAFSHLGSNMLANVLRSDIAVQRSLQIIRIFTSLEAGVLETKMEEELQEHLKGIYHMIKVIVDEINMLRDKYHDLEKRLSSQSKMGIQMDFSQISSPAKPEVLISSAQAQKLKSIVASITPERKAKMKLWSRFKIEFNLTRYVHLPAHKFDEAMRWLQNFVFD